MKNKINKPTIYYNEDADLKIIFSKTVLIIGYGNQGRAQAKNLSDSGVNVMIGLNKTSKSWNLVEKDNLIPIDIESGVSKADIISILIPDEIMSMVYLE